jgi:putative serine protease PepD
MRRKRTAIVVAAAALAGAGGGAGGYAAVAGGGGAATTAATGAATIERTAAATGNLSVGDVYRKVSKGVVEITATSTSTDTAPYPGGSGSSQSQGSGFVYDGDGDGHIVTNYHVVQGATSLTVTFADGSKYPATVVGHDASTDLAVLEVDAPAGELQPLTLADSSAVKVGDGVVAIGSPFGLDETVTSGIVSALDRTISSDTSYSISGAIQTDAAINPGNSGGPLLNMSGEVIGVNSQIESGSGGNDGVGFAISSNTVRSVVSQLLRSGKVVHAYLGISVQAPAKGGGAEVASVVAGSPASDAGLQSGDVITSFGGETITSPDDLTSAVNAKQPGEKVAVTYTRDGSTKTTGVTLGKRA